MTEDIIRFFISAEGIAITAIFTIIGIPLSIILACLSRKVRAPRYMLRTILLEWEDPRGPSSATIVRWHIARMRARLDLKSRVLQKIPNIGNGKLHLTYFAFWNAGREVIKSTDVSKTNPLRLEVGGRGSIEWARLEETSNPDNLFKLEIQDSTLLVDFDHINHNDGIVVKIIHLADQERPIHLLGSFVEAGEAKKIYFGGSTEDGYWTRLLISLHLAGFFGIPGIINFITSIPELTFFGLQSIKNEDTPLIWLGSTFCILVGYIVFPRRPPSRLRRAFEATIDFEATDGASENKTKQKPNVPLSTSVSLREALARINRSQTRLPPTHNS